MCWGVAEERGDVGKGKGDEVREEMEQVWEVCWGPHTLTHFPTPPPYTLPHFSTLHTSFLPPNTLPLINLTGKAR